MNYRHSLSVVLLSAFSFAGLVVGGCSSSDTKSNTSSDAVSEKPDEKTEEMTNGDSASEKSNEKTQKVVKNIFFQEDKTGKILFISAPEFKEWETVYLDSKAPLNAPGYQAIDVGDLNQDQVDDILFQNLETGENIYFDGASKTWQAINRTPEIDAIGIGDINQDNVNDILFYNPKNSQTLYYDGSSKEWVSLEDTQGQKPGAIGDLNRDDIDDILFYEPETGISVYKDQGKGEFIPVKSSNDQVIGNTPQWKLIGIGDIDQDGTNDIVFQGPQGETTYWNGATGKWADNNITVIQGWKPLI